MIIDSYAVQASAQRSYLSVKSTTTTAVKQVLGAPENEKGKEAEVRPGDEGKETVSISDAAKEMQEKLKEYTKQKLSQQADAASNVKAAGKSKLPKSPEELKLSLLEMMIEKLTGKKARFRMRSPSLDSGSGSSLHPNLQAMMKQGGQGRPQAVNAWQTESFTYEAEAVSYQAQGVINTADGRTINVDVSMYMSREFMSYSSVSVLSQNPCDPLVINYGGNAASLTGEKFDFDLTMDGKTEKVAELGQGSGFLALDKNGDGKIGDGSELFGPGTGSGFGELRSYDGDGNGWIDENDEIFSKLNVWSRDKDGNDQLFTLKELGIGAIYLGDVETEFSFKDDNNQTTGVMRSTSFFLKEDGGAGTISHVDMML